MEQRDGTLTFAAEDVVDLFPFQVRSLDIL
jgi:hypothetical protein